MSRYTVLLILNLPFILAGFMRSTVNYKLREISKRRYILSLLFWIVILIGVALAEPIYQFLFSHNLTQTESLSLFDVVQITGIVTLFYITNRSRGKVEVLERRLQDLHQELSIRLSKETSDEEIHKK